MNRWHEDWEDSPSVEELYPDWVDRGYNEDDLWDEEYDEEPQFGNEFQDERDWL